MGEFQARSVELLGSFRIESPVAEAFELFSPLGERGWVPGWSPELLHPPAATWERGLVFRTREERGEAIWVVSQLDREGHAVEYHRVEAGRYVARVAVRCAPRGERETDVHVAYTFVGLSETGNAEIAFMTPEAYEQKMERWKVWITGHLRLRPPSASGGRRSGGGGPRASRPARRAARRPSARGGARRGSRSRS